MNNKAYILLATAGILWGIQPIFVKIVVASMTPSSLIFFRYIFLSGTLFIIMKVLGEKKLLPPKNCWFRLFLMGLTGVALNNGSQFAGLQYSTVANATLIATLTPAMTALFAAIFLRERLNLLQWIGIFISMSGTLYLISNGSLDTILNTSFNFGDVLFFFAQMMWAVYCLLSVKVMQKMSALSVTAWAGIIGGMLTGIWGEFTEGIALPEFSMAVIISIIFIIWCGGVAALAFWNMGTKTVGASSAAIFLNLMPIVGIVGAAFTLGEELTLNEFFGAIVILGGVYITTHSDKFVRMSAHILKHKKICQVILLILTIS